jgi:hypothetical protein
MSQGRASLASHADCPPADPANKLAAAGVNLDSWMAIGDSMKGIEVDACVPVTEANSQTY